MTSRLTFRDKSHGICWQKTLRDKYAEEGTPNVPHLEVKRAIIRPVSRSFAKQIILKYEWLGTMASTSHHYGIFFGPFCAGVTCIAVGGGTGSVYAHRPFGIPRSALGILARGACVHWAPLGTNSRLVAWSARLMRQSCVKLLLAYSDKDAGEIGTIYQACGWSHLGLSGRKQQWVSPNGRVVSSSIQGNLRRATGYSLEDCRATLRRDGWRPQHGSAKGRYVCILDKTDISLMKRVEEMRQPYPKRVGSVGSDTPAQPGGKGRCNSDPDALTV